MKRIAKPRKKFHARLECFEQRLCMASDLYAFPEVNEILDPTPIADYADSPIVETDDDFILNPRDDFSSDGNLVDVLPESYGRDDFVDTFPDRWGEIEPEPEPDFPGDGVDPIDGDDDRKTINPEGFVDDSPVEKVPGTDDPTVPPVLDRRRDPIPPRNVDPGTEDPILEGFEIAGENTGNQSTKPSDPQNQENKNPKPQTSPPGEAKHPESSPVLTEYQESTNAVFRRVEMEMNRNLPVATIENRAVINSHNSPASLPSASIGMQRFSSTDIAFTTMNDVAVSSPLAGEAFAMRSFANGRPSSSDSPRYFVRRQESGMHTGGIRLRESYSDQSIGHESEDLDWDRFHAVANDILVGKPDDGESVDSSSHYVATVLAGYFHRPETIFEPAMEKAIAFQRGTVEHTDVDPLATEPDRKQPDPDPPRTRSLQRFLGLMVAGALITIQESSRTLKSMTKKKMRYI